jgi:pimeloyl-ACP methyl ester carboxylesterase
MEKAIKIDDIDLHYAVDGTGPDMILMHGWGCSSATLASIANVATRFCTVYNIDFPGFGASTEPSEVWGVEDYTQLLEKFIAATGITNPILLGHSFGGRVGLLYSSRHSVAKLILVDAAGVKPKRTLLYYYKVYSYKFACRTLRFFLGTKLAQPIIDRFRARRGSSDYNDASPMMRRILSRVVNEDLTGVMPMIKAPTLLVWGEDDRATPLSDAKTMERLIPGAGLVSFPNCGHYSFLDNQGQFAAVLSSFLNS